MSSPQQTKPPQSLLLVQLPTEIISMIYKIVIVLYLTNSEHLIVDIYDLVSITTSKDPNINPLIPARACKLLRTATLKAFYENIMAQDEVCAWHLSLAKNNRDVQLEETKHVFRDIQHLEIKLKIGSSGFDFNLEKHGEWLKNVTKAMEDRVQIAKQLKKLHVHIALCDNNHYTYSCTRSNKKATEVQIEAALSSRDRRVRHAIAFVVGSIQDLDVETSALSFSAYKEQQEVVDMKGGLTMNIATAMLSRVGDAGVVFRF